MTKEVWLSDVDDPLELLLFAQGFVKCDSALADAAHTAHQCADGG
ncbi:MAG TPA: hypothetical protein VGJ84_03315 [Polyangiaceae bacterium]